MAISLSQITFKKIQGFAYKRFIDFKINKIRTLPRKKPGYFSFFGYTVNYVDSLGFFHQYKDIFKDKIYHFTSVSRTPNIIDAGGCIGMSTLYFKLLYPESKITVFEPDPDIFKVLSNNISRNKLTKINLINAALGKQTGIIDFYPDNSDGGSLYALDNRPAVPVPVTKLSDYINEPIDLLKIDIEGMEGEVFEEIEHKLYLVREIVFEYHDFYNLPQKLGTILSILERNGFSYLVADATNMGIQTPFTLPENYRYLNIVYAKKLE